MSRPFSIGCRGLSKFVEEAGEVAQVVGKIMAFPRGDHPDGAGCLRMRLAEQIADALAAIDFVVAANGLERVTAPLPQDVGYRPGFDVWLGLGDLLGALAPALSAAAGIVGGFEAGAKPAFTSMSVRLAEALGTANCALTSAAKLNGLDQALIADRRAYKRALFHEWFGEAQAA